MEPSILIQDIYSYRKGGAQALLSFCRKLDPKQQKLGFQGNPNKAVALFDLACQIALIRIASNEKTPSPVELLFIREVGSFSYSLEQFLEEFDSKAEHPLGLNFAELASMDCKAIKDNLQAIEDLLHPMWLDFAEAFSSAEATRQFQLYKAVEAAITHIANCFLLLGGEKSEEEIRFANTLVQEEMLLPLLRAGGAGLENALVSQK